MVCVVCSVAVTRQLCIAGDFIFLRQHAEQWQIKHSHESRQPLSPTGGRCQNVIRYNSGSIIRAQPLTHTHTYKTLHCCRSDKNAPQTTFACDSTKLSDGTAHMYVEPSTHPKKVELIRRSMRMQCNYYSMHHVHTDRRHRRKCDKMRYALLLQYLL